MASLSLLIALITVSLSAITQVSGANLTPSDCCLKVNDKVVPRQNVRDYFLQDESSGCTINAVVLITRRRKHLCAPHNAKWVQKRMSEVDGRRGRKKRHNQSHKVILV